MTLRTRIILAALLIITAGVYAFTPAPIVALLRYWLRPDYPRFTQGEHLALSGLSETVEVHRYTDGRYRISARNESDLYRVEGYLQARDRLFQMDLLRHIAQGRLAEMVGEVHFGRGTTLDLDRFNRFMEFAPHAQQILTEMPSEQQMQLESFAAGVNAWIESGQRSLEHRLLQAEVEPWKPVDSLTVLRLLLFGLTHNYTREAQRLLIACDAGLNAMERIWPTEIEFGPVFLPPEDVPTEQFPIPPAVVPEIRASLDSLCPKGGTRGPAARDASVASSVSPLWGRVPIQIAGTLFLLRDGLQASNNWVVAGSRTRSGLPILANDPHLPHMSPPIVWGVHQVLPDRQVVGFTFPGLHAVVFGHNFSVAWGGTVNNVDLQDLYVEKLAPRSDDPTMRDDEAYLYDGEARRFEVRRERFLVRGGEPVTSTVRYSIHGPVLNDLDPFLRDRIPVTTLRSTPTKGTRDGIALELMLQARNASQFLEAVEHFDTACTSWVFADTEGEIGFVSPCRVPIRGYWQGTFPVPGWLSRYEWKGFVRKEELPRSLNPRRGWLTTSNNRALPRDRYPTTYNSDPSPPSRYLRISASLREMEDATVADMAGLQLDTRLPYWPGVRSEVLARLCATEGEVGVGDLSIARQSLCTWDGDLSADSVGGTIFTLLLHALIDRALADELSDGPEGALWEYVQSIPHIETNVDWIWQRGADDPVWDDVRTDAVESRDDIVRLAFRDAVALGVERFGDEISEWRWGEVRPFEIRHPLAWGNPFLARVLNSPRLPGVGAPETVFKNQFLRADRKEMHPAVGPVFRMVVDMAAPSAAGFTLAGGQSGWPRSPHYADLVEEWTRNEMRPLTPTDSEGDWLRIEFRPG